MGQIRFSLEIQAVRVLPKRPIFSNKRSGARLCPNSRCHEPRTAVNKCNPQRPAAAGGYEVAKERARAHVRGADARDAIFCSRPWRRGSNCAIRKLHYLKYRLKASARQYRLASFVPEFLTEIAPAWGSDVAFGTSRVGRLVRRTTDVANGKPTATSTKKHSETAIGRKTYPNNRLTLSISRSIANGLRM